MGGDKITVQIHQPKEGLFGPPTVNVFILDSKQFHEYQEVVEGYRESFGKCYSVWDISLKTFTWTASYTDTYYLVLDNTDSIRGGHFYSDMFVDIRVEKETPVTPKPISPVKRPTPKEPGFGVISAIAGVLIVLYLIRRNK
ncbi:MAG: PGF-CTERM sorting domain-containing protein [Euryarchaeota archaeon]|nr:PGF-CTERM sorting domain-containing protein [Euryarchaeota archaeon]